MDLEDLLPAVPVGQRHLEDPVEPPRPEHGPVQHEGPVRGGEDDHPSVVGEPVHLRQKLVARVHLLGPRPARPGLAQSIELIDEDHARGFLPCKLKEVADLRRAHANVLVHELRPGAIDERNVCLRRDRPRQQRLPRARLAHQEHPGGSPDPHLQESLWLPQELDDLLDLVLDDVDPGDVPEGRHDLLGVHDLEARGLVLRQEPDLGGGVEEGSAHGERDADPHQPKEEVLHHRQVSRLLDEDTMSH
mmetsp:Transcript_4998/g.15161  ORF Transcript_4998/g.15161 Transcript_4998/m.15161 type:complete len:247 (+) Transcript_4998:938-1678(+)